MNSLEEIKINDIFESTPALDLENRVAALEEKFVNHGHDDRNTPALHATMYSQNFKSGVSGWQIRDNGDAEFNSGTFRGALSAATIDIGGSDATSFHVDIDGNIWSGDATFASAPFKVSNAGVLTASGATITGTITGSSLDIPDAVTANSFHVDTSGNTWWGSTLLGSAAAKVLNTGAGTFSSMTITGGAISGTPISAIPNDTNTDISLLEATHDLVFSVTDKDTVAWATGTITLSNDRTFSITGANTGNMVARTYIYLDTGVSSTLLQTTTTVSSAIGANKKLIAVAQNGAAQSQFTVYGGIGGLKLPASGTSISNNNWNYSGIWSVTDADTIAWGAGTLTTSDGGSYSIDAGNTGNMVAKTYVYFDLGTSSTVLQTTTTAATSVGDGKILLAVCQNGTGEANYLVMNDKQSNIDAAQIVAGSITANEIATGTISADRMNVSQLSAIAADMGTITAGSISVVNGGNTIGLTPGGTNAIFSGTTGSPEFKVTPAGVLTATGATISGALTATSGAIGGWTINSASITDAAGTVGLSSAVTVGDDIRFWAGHATPASAPFKVTEAGALTATSATITGALTTGALSSIDGQYLTAGSVASASANLAMRGWTYSGAFSATDADTVAWATGTFTASDGTAYSITGGNTGNMVALTYIYLDIAVSTTAFQTTTTAATSVGNGKVLIAVAENHTANATYQVFGGTGGVNLMVDNLVANSASTNEFISNSAQLANLVVTNAKINDLAVSKLTAGSITSKAITLVASDADVKIQAGKTDFTNTEAGFILGIDYNGTTNPAKFYIGDSSTYMNWTGSALNIDGATLTAGTIQTASGTGTRMVISGADNFLNFYNASNELVGRVGGGAGAAQVFKASLDASTTTGLQVLSSIDGTAGIQIISSANVTLDGIAVSLTNTGSGNDGYGMSIIHNGASAATGLNIDRANGSGSSLNINHSTSGTAFDINVNSGTGDAINILAGGRGIFIDQSTNYTALTIDGSTSSQYLVNIDQAGSAGGCVLINRSADGGNVLQLEASYNSAVAVYGLAFNLANEGAGVEYAFAFNGSEYIASATSVSGLTGVVKVSTSDGTGYIPVYSGYA